MVRTAASAALTAALLVSAQAGGQIRAQELRVEPCQGCRLTERVVATLGRPDDSVLVTLMSRVVRLGATRYLVGPVSEPGQLAIYRSNGTLERVIGRQGGGPAEFSPHLGPIIPLMSGSAVVVDRQNARLTLIDSLGNMRPYGRLSGSVFFGAALPDGRLVINAQYPPGERFGFPLHVIDQKRIVRSFGGAAATTGPRSGPAIRVLAPAQSGGVWFSPNDRYELNLADSLGQVSTALSRPFASPPPDGSGMLTFAVSSMREDRDGRVWVVSGHRRPGTAPRKEALVTAGTLQTLAAGLTSMVDIVDPKRGTVIYSQMFDGPPRQFIADGLAYGYREDADGNPRIELVSLRFTSSSRR